MTQLAINQLPALVTVDRNQLRLDDSINDSQIAEVRTVLETEQANINWLIGDYYSEVARLRPTKSTSPADEQLYMKLEVENNERVQVMVAESVQGRASARQACRVSEILAPSERVPGLSWGHHACVLGEYDLLAGDKLERGEYERLKGEALKMLGFVDREQRAGNLVSIKELSQMIRQTRHADAEGQGGGEPPEPMGNPAVGDAFREINRVSMILRKVKLAELDDYSRSELLRLTEPLIEWRKQLEAEQ